MAYIGPAPKLGQNREVDDISSGFNGSTTAFTLQVGGSNASPGSANNIIVSVNNVVLNPNTAYTVNGSTITFTSAPTNGQAFFGLILGQGIDSGEVSNGSVSTVKLADDAVTSAKIADDAVVAAAIADNAVVTAAINADAVTSAKIADDAVVAAAIADNAVVTAAINADAVTSAKIADNAVVTAAINADAVTGAKIADDSINSEHYVDGSIDTAHIADSQVTTAKIAADAVTNAKIAASAISATELDSNAVTTAKIAADAVTNAKLADGCIATEQIADDAVTLAKMADDSVSASQIINNAVTVNAIANDAVTTDKINDNSVNMNKLADLDNGRIIARVTSGSGNPEAATAAQIRTLLNVADGATAGGGKILQVVQSISTSQVTSTESDYQSNPTNTNLNASITPASSSNKVLVNIDANFAGSGCRINPVLIRNSTDISFGVSNEGLMDYGLFRDGNNSFRFSFMYLDSPSTTSAMTYKLYFSRHGGSGTATFNKAQDSGQKSVSTITLMEVQG